VSDPIHYVVQTFTEADGRLIADVPLDASCASEAATLALAFRSCKAGVIAFEWSGEMQLGRPTEPFVIAAFGWIPEECQVWVRTGGVEERTPRKRASLTAVAG